MSGPPRDAVRAAQDAAADPNACAWVNANAGTGKTHVLTMRVLRLMLAGAAPDRILCLTYTKAAAAEMSNRVFDALARWASVAPKVLAEDLKKLLGRTPSADDAARGRALFAAVIETPGGLKIQTIHAFAQRLLELCPLESGAPPGFTLLDEDQAEAARRDATNAVLQDATADRSTRLGLAVDCAVRHAAGENFDAVLSAALGERAWIEAMRRLPSREDEGLWDDVSEFYRALLGVRPRVTRDALDRELNDAMSAALLSRLREALAGGEKTDRDAARKLAAAAAAPLHARIELLDDFFCTGKGEPRKKLMTKAVEAAHSRVAALAAAAQTEFCRLIAERRALDVADATVALLEIADAVMQGYTEAKSRQAALDFDDLVEKAARLLAPGASGDLASFRDWALHKLGGGLDHVLVDEAQDTSPVQWDIVEALTSGFFSKDGSGRTLFGVGDEKQSIYGFQGAAPEMFADAGRRFKAQVEASGRAWRDVALTASFRTVAPILSAVDAVFRDAARTPGLGPESRRIEHRAERAGQAGLVEVWPIETPDGVDASDPWSPLDETGVRPPVARLAERIAKTIRAWIDQGETLASENRPIRPGDILILVRGRKPFAPAVVAALESQQVPVAGADRLRLLDEIAIADLLALGDALLLPDDDLQLAAVLKSPLFGFDDDDLFMLAHERRGSLLASLAACAESNGRYAEALASLKRWRSDADRLPPFEFYAGVLDRAGGRARMLARLGPEAADPIDEFMNVALAYDSIAAPSLAGFLDAMRASAREIKRDMDESGDAVRVMTVHGAKGLEAPIVFLPDTCGTKAGRTATLLPLQDTALPSTVREAFVWAVKGSSRVAAVAAARAAEAERDARERQRLLYVAMTRARDRLYVAGYRGVREPGEDCWHNLVTDALAPRLETVELPDGATVRRLSSAQTATCEAPRIARGSTSQAAEPPGWAAAPLPPEPRAPVPITPSGLGEYEAHHGNHHHGGDGAEAPHAPQIPLTDDSRFLRGTLTHALLEHLPSLPPETWPDAGLAYVARRGAALDPASHPEIVAQALAILRDPELAPLFGPESQAEVPVAAYLPRPNGKGPPLKLSGQIDRLAIVDGEALIIDYKTNRVAPAGEADVPDAYLYQLAAYRLALARIFPGAPLRAAILWTAGPRLMKIPAATLDAYESRLWNLPSTALTLP